MRTHIPVDGDRIVFDSLQCVDERRDRIDEVGGCREFNGEENSTRSDEWFEVGSFIFDMV